MSKNNNKIKLTESMLRDIIRESINELHTLKAVQNPQQLGYNYGGGKRGFMGIGKKANTWRLNESKLMELISESIKKALSEMAD